MIRRPPQRHVLNVRRVNHINKKDFLRIRIKTWHYLLSDFFFVKTQKIVLRLDARVLDFFEKKNIEASPFLINTIIILSVMLLKNIDTHNFYNS